MRTQMIAAFLQIKLKLKKQCINWINTSKNNICNKVKTNSLMK